MRRVTLLLVCFALGFLPVHAAEKPAGEARIQTYSGWEDSLVLTGGDCKVVATPAVGGRVVCFSVNGENVIYEDPESWGKTLATAPAGFSMGGYQCDLGPELRGIPDHPGLWLGRWQAESPRPGVMLLRSQPDAATGVQMEKEIVIDPDTGEVGLRQRLKNVSSADISYCLWDRTLCRGGGYGLLPLGGRSRFKAGWSMARKDAAGKTVYDGERPKDARARVLDHVLVVEARGGWFKAGVDSDAEWIAYTVGRLLLIKYFPHFHEGLYSEGGNSGAFYCDEKRAGLEPLSPEVKLAPGQSYVFPEKWVLLELARRVETFSEARALVKQIPPSPFRK